MASIGELWWQCDELVVARIKALNITGAVPADTIGQKVYSHIWPDWEIFPCVVTTEENQVPRRIGGDNTQIEFELPVVVWIGDSASPNQHARKALYMEWFGAIHDAFMEKELGTIAHDCTIDVTPFIDRRIPEYQRVVCGMALKFKVMKDR